jgi:hypothetical protein
MSHFNDVRFTFSTPADEAIQFDVVSFELTEAISDLYQVTDAMGQVFNGVLNDQGFAVVNAVSPGPTAVDFKQDPADPWDAASYFNNLKKEFASPPAPPAPHPTLDEVEAATAQGLQVLQNHRRLPTEAKTAVALAQSLQDKGLKP